MKTDSYWKRLGTLGWLVATALTAAAADAEPSPAEVLARLKANIAARDIDGTALACNEAARIAGEPYPGGPTYPTQDGPTGLTRREKLEFRLGVLERLAAGVDKDNWREVEFSLNVGAPGVPVAGMDPAAVKDPVVRKEYERRIAENRAKSEKNRRNNHLEYFKPIWVRTTGHFVTRNYTKNPADLAEIKSAIEAMVNESALRAELQKLLGVDGKQQNHGSSIRRSPSQNQS